MKFLGPGNQQNVLEEGQNWYRMVWGHMGLQASPVLCACAGGICLSPGFCPNGLGPVVGVCVSLAPAVGLLGWTGHSCLCGPCPCPPQKHRGLSYPGLGRVAHTRAGTGDVSAATWHRVPSAEKGAGWPPSCCCVYTLHMLAPHAHTHTQGTHMHLTPLTYANAHSHTITPTHALTCKHRLQPTHSRSHTHQCTHTHTPAEEFAAGLTLFFLTTGSDRPSLSVRS